MALSRKHFREMAKACARLPDDDNKTVIVNSLARINANANPRFQRGRFLAACYRKD